MLGLIEIPASMNRVVEIPAHRHLLHILLEDVILPAWTVALAPTSRSTARSSESPATPRSIRTARASKEEDYRQHMKRILKKRLRHATGSARGLGVAREGDAQDHPQGARASRRSVFTCDIPLDLGYVFGIEGKIPEHLRNELLFTPFKPQSNPNIDMTRSIREQVLQHDSCSFIPMRP